MAYWAAMITIDLPKACNALNSEVLRLLARYFLEAEADDGSTPIILDRNRPGVHARVDLKEAAAGGQGDADDAIGAVESRRARSPYTKPLIGAVNGVAVTGGLEEQRRTKYSNIVVRHRPGRGHLC